MPQCDTLKTKRKNKICPEAPRLTALNAVTADAKEQKSLKKRAEIFKGNPSAIPLRIYDRNIAEVLYHDI